MSSIRTIILGIICISLTLITSPLSQVFAQLYPSPTPDGYNSCTGLPGCTVETLGDCGSCGGDAYHKRSRTTCPGGIICNDSCVLDTSCYAPSGQANCINRVNCSWITVTDCGGGVCGCGSQRVAIERCNGVHCNDQCAPSGSCSGDCGGGPPSTPTPTLTPTPTPPGYSYSEGTYGTPPPDGTANARAKIIPATASTCADVNSSNNYLSESIGLTGQSNQVAAGGSYASWSVSPGTYTISDLPPSGYVLKLACWTGVSPASSGTGVSAYISSGQTVTWELGYTLGTAWVQTQGGDVHSQGIISSYIPDGATSPYFSTNGSSGIPGVVTYGTTYDFDSVTATQGEDAVSQEGWLASQSYASTDFYQVMYHRFGSPTATDYSGGTTLTSKLASREAPYYITGDVVIDTANWNVGASESIVVLVNGNLSIRRNITITPGGFVAFIVNGNITIDPSVGGLYSSSAPVLEGVYITSPTGEFQTGDSSVVGSERLVTRGTFVAGDFLFQRDLASVAQNQNVSAELFIYNPQLLLTMPDAMRDLPVSWQEVAP